MWWKGNVDIIVRKDTNAYYKRKVLVFLNVIYFYLGTFVCPEGYYKCRNSYCINTTLICDGTIDCKATHSDEENCRKL